MNPHNILTLKGIYRDIIRSPQGQQKYDSGWRSNLIVNNARRLLAAFMRNDPSQALGVQSLAIGRGDPAWDDKPSAPNASDDRLFDATPVEIAATDLELVYLNESDLVVNTPTSRLQITATLGPNVPLADDFYPLREFGLFGRFDGNPFMIDYVIHPVIYKGPEDTLIRSIRLIF
ncbi:hypothetical protein KJ068_13585 [bacterium]|nr:hypothetical protein [bacterium]